MKFVSKIKYAPVYLLSLIPFPLLYLISDLGYVFLYYVIRYRRKVVRKNILIAFQNKEEIFYRKIEKQFYRQFCDIMMETSKPLTISESEIKKRYKVTNPELIEKYYNEQKSILMYAAHTGNWEWFATIPTQIPHNMLTLYQPLTNGYFNGLMKLIRSRFGMECVESAKGFRTIMEYASKDVLTLSLLASDQRPGNRSPKHDTLFFGRPTSFLVGADRIARKSNQIVVYPEVKRKKRGFYELEFILISDDAASTKENEIIDRYAKILENAISKNPSLWLWSHNRWKNSPVEETNNEQNL